MKPAKVFVSLVSVLFFLSSPLQAAAPVFSGPQNVQPERPPQTTASQQPGQPAGDPTAEFMMASSLSAAETSPFLGVEEGGTVSGIVEIRPNQEQLPGIRKVAYYLNGSQSGKVYQSPFMWGGTSGNGTTGFDTRNIADGNYTLSMTYTDSTGDHTLTLNFKVNNTSTPPPTTTLPRGAADRNIWGIENGQTLTGNVNIYPNYDRVPAGSQVTWTLEGRTPVTVTQQPYLFGGAGSNGTQSLDTTGIPDGIYRLTMVASVPSGGVSDEVIVRINNQPDTAPTTAPISASGRTLGGEIFPAGTSFVDVDKAGNFSFLAAEHTLYIVNSSNTANPQVVSAVNFSATTPILDIMANPAGTGVFVLEQGPLVNEQFRNRLWFVDVSNPSSPVLTLKAQLRDSPRITLQQDPSTGARVRVFYPSQGENFIVDCAASGAGACTTNFYYLYTVADIVHTYQNHIISTRPGASFVTLNHNDATDTPTPSPVVSASGKENYFFVSMENGTTAVYDVNQANTSATGNGILPVVNTINPDGNDPISNFIFGNRLVVLDSTGLIETFDITNPLNVTKVDSVTVAGARSVDYDGTNFYAVTEREYRIIGPAASTPPPTGDSRVLGVTEGQKVSGVVSIRPNQQQLPGIRKVAYYLNGMKSGKVYQSPFMWGGVSGTGTSGFDTRTIADGNYTLDLVYTDATGDHTITVHFTVDN